MTRREKLLNRMRSNPKGIHPEEIDSLLVYCGFEKRRSGKNHCVYRLGEEVLVVNFHRDYVHFKSVKEILVLLDELFESI